jgi:G3E family GTPase
LSISPETRAAVTIVAGFLGSGKTTLVNYILTNEVGLRAAVLVNEFGEIGIDNELIVGVEERIVLLSNGCVCCTINDDLISTTRELLQRYPDLNSLFVETSGVADPLPLAGTFVKTGLRAVTRLDSIVTVVDAENFSLNLDRTAVARAQIDTADILLLNKTDLVSPDELFVLESRLRFMKPAARIYRTSHGRIPISLLLDVSPFEDGSIWETAEAPHAAHHLHADEFDSVAVQSPKPLSPERFQHFLKVLLPDSVFRAKGILWFYEDDRRHVFHLCGSRSSFASDKWPSDARSNRAVFIGKSLDKAAIQSAFLACCA